ncbi:MFS family permease [Rhodoligotrophos appendicifer]|uniref:YbfB/YjiJ family MFS transporter n=1 Tax=Rhodoligotrophos appendicifer TaxID=987056 RepID=UPI0019603774|nr:YbfB/YjiJ family MFS transporter [Rhodoligotrophos appendicifer]
MTDLLRSTAITGQERRASGVVIALAGATSLAVSVGIGRFAFTPILPMMLHEGSLDLTFASWLATVNYVGYLIGALLCMVVPRRWPSVRMIKGGLIVTILCTAGMALHLPQLWLVLRFFAGITSAIVFVYTSGWCLARLSRLGRVHVGAIIYTGPGMGIALPGLAAMAMVAYGVSASHAWISFSSLAVLLSAGIWQVFTGPDFVVAPAAQPLDPAPGQQQQPDAGGSAEMSMFSFTYGLAGFGYIITATFLPVIAREALPESLWLDFFWPVLGLGVITGALLSGKIPPRADPRHVLAGWYLVQASGVMISLLFPTVPGFIIGSFMVGMPLTAVGFVAMQDVRRLRPHHAARFMALLTATFGIGQIIGPPIAAFLLSHSASHAEGFAWALGLAAGSLFLGILLYIAMSLLWPIRRPAH